MKTVKWLINNLKKEKYIVLWLCLVNMCISLSVIGFALMTKRIIDTATGALNSTLLIEGFFVFLIIGVRIVLGVVNNRLSAISTAKISIKLQKSIFKSILLKKYNKISLYHSGDIINRLTSDVDISTAAFINIPVNSVSMFTKIVAGLVSMLVLDPLFSILVIIIGVAVFSISRFFSEKFKYIHKLCQKTNGIIRSFISEIIQNISVVKSFNASNKTMDKLDIIYDESVQLQLKRNLIGTISSMGIYSIFTVSYYSALCIGAAKLSSGAITVGTLMAFLQLINQVQTPFRTMSSNFSQYYSGIASAERLIELESIDSEDTNVDKITTFKIIEFLKVSFSYNDEVILESSNFTINKGDFICITGDSGIGKSSIIKLLLSFEQPKSGNINVDGISISVSHRSLFSYVPQNNMILSGTIKENIVFCSEENNEAKITSAIRIACAYDFINSLPNGINTEIGENGLGLSEGQIQRLAIARAIYNNCEILLLDEATSALDINVEKTILQNIKNTGKTVFLITHKKTGIDFCTKTIEIKNKKIIEKENV